MKQGGRKYWASAMSITVISMICSANPMSRIGDGVLHQYRVIGFAGGRLTTFVVEYREDTIGELI